MGEAMQGSEKMKIKLIKAVGSPYYRRKYEMEESTFSDGDLYEIIEEDKEIEELDAVSRPINEQLYEHFWKIQELVRAVNKLKAVDK